jgi:hypothetical protein
LQLRISCNLLQSLKMIPAHLFEALRSHAV